MTQADIVSYANIKTHHERRHPTLEGVTVGEKDDEVLEAVELVKNVMNETGEILLKNGHKCLGEFVAEALGEAEKMDKQQAEGNKGADLVVERVSRPSSQVFSPHHRQTLNGSIVYPAGPGISRFSGHGRH